MEALFRWFHAAVLCSPSYVYFRLTLGEMTSWDCLTMRFWRHATFVRVSRSRLAALAHAPRQVLKDKNSKVNILHYSTSKASKAYSLFTSSP